MSPGIIPGQFGSRIYYEQLRCWPQMNRPGGRAYRPPCPRLDLDPLGQDREPGLKTRSTMVHRRRFSGTWRSSDAGTPGSRILSPTAGRKPPKSERSKVCCASSIFPLANRQYRWSNLIHLFFASDFLSSKRALRHPAFPATIGQHDGPASRQALARSNDPHLGGETADGSAVHPAAVVQHHPYEG